MFRNTQLGTKMGSTLDDVCDQLDNSAIKILLLMEDLMKCKLRMEEEMKSGYINIAKTRYIMGNKSVCSLQIPSEGKEISALTTVVSSVEDASGVQCNKYNLQSINPTSKRDQEDEKTDESTVRKRTTAIHQDSKKSDNKKSPQESKCEDPIKWFGVLVPQNLRFAQSSFKLALEFSIESANIQAELDACVAKYQELKDVKILLNNGEREP